MRDMVIEPRPQACVHLSLYRTERFQYASRLGWRVKRREMARRHALRLGRGARSASLPDVAAGAARSSCGKLA
jgi:hypothetical protein